MSDDSMEVVGLAVEDVVEREECCDSLKSAKISLLSLLDKDTASK